MPPEPSHKIIIDTDPGVDDAIAVLMALASPELDVVGLSAVYGNVTAPVAAANARRLLDAAGRTGVPVAAGAAHPLLGTAIGPVDFIHGPEGLGDTVLAPPSQPAVTQHAADFLYSMARAAPGEITIVAVGPLTNLALAVRLHPDLPSLLRSVVVMGGNAYVGGNATAAGEANIVNDPVAADVVFSQDWDLTMVGLDVTNQVNLTPEQLRLISSVDQPPNELLRTAMPFYQRFYEENIPGYTGLCPHDAVAIAWLLQPELFETVERPVAVGLNGIGRGKTWPADPFHIRPGTPWEGRRPTQICTAVDSAGVSSLIVERLTR